MDNEEAEAESEPEVKIEIERGIPLKPRMGNSVAVEAIRKLHIEGEVDDSIFIPMPITTNYVNTMCTNIGGSGWFAQRKQKSVEGKDEGIRVWKILDTRLSIL